MSLWEWIKIVLLGIVEGVTEWLPISSTGHLLLLDQWLKIEGSASFKDAFWVVIQLGAVLAVIVLFGKRLWPFQEKEKSGGFLKRETVLLWLKTAAACIPGAAAVSFLSEQAENALEQPLVIAVALVGYGVLFLLLEKKKSRPPRVTRAEDLTLWDAFRIGLFQVLSVVPGTSRSGSTILGGLAIGSDRKTAAEFSFFLAIPVMAGYSGLKLLQNGLSFSLREWEILAVGSISAFLTSLFVVKRLMNYLKKNGFALFGWYRIALGLIVIIQIWIKQ